MSDTAWYSVAVVCAALGVLASSIAGKLVLICANLTIMIVFGILLILSRQSRSTRRF